MLNLGDEVVRGEHRFPPKNGDSDGSGEQGSGE